MRKDKKRLLRRLIQVGFPIGVTIVIIAAFVFVTQGRDMPILNPQGTIANQQFQLIMITLGLGLLVVVPVFILLFSIAWRYRASNTKAKYEPELAGNRGLEALWWGIPIVIILILSIITAISTYALDPFKKLDSTVKPVKIQVVAMEWKWLFIYPEEGIATVNYLNIPEDTPVDFTITADAPMNSFWVPALGGQVYAMSGMSTELSLMADTVGTYNGSSANISGDGFADMRFKVNSMSKADYIDWRKKAIFSDNMLTSETYENLVIPSKANPEATYMLMNSDLYNEIIMKYMASGSSDSEKTAPKQTHDMSGMTH